MAADGEGVDYRAQPVLGLGRVLGLWLCVVDFPWQARGLGFTDSVAEPGKFFAASKIVRACVFGVAFDRPCAGFERRPAEVRRFAPPKL